MINNDDYNTIKESNLFDAEWFIEEYNLPDETDAIEFYLTYGVDLGLNPTHNFDIIWYLNHYPDIKSADMDPFIHFIKFGKSENRFSFPIKPTISNNKYLLNNGYDDSFFKRYDDLIYEYREGYLKNNLNIGVFVKSAGVSFLPTAYIRLIIPFYHLFLEKNINPFLFCNPDFPKIQDESLFLNVKLLDVIIVQRDCLDDETAKILVALCKKFGTKLIYEIDDDLLGIDETHPDYEFFYPKKKTIEYLVKNSDIITVSTNNLKEKLCKINPDVFIIKNTSNRLLNEMYCNKISNKIKIGYMGSLTHDNDIKMVENVIGNVKRYFINNNVEIIFEIIGGSSEDLNFAKRIDIPDNFIEYPHFINWLKNVVDWDIGLAPLENSLINHSKSEIKYIEYSSLGVPGIYSDVGAYSEVIANEKNGILVKNNSVEEWEKAIINLIENTQLRNEIVKNSKKHIEENHSIDVMIEQWENLFELILDDYQKIIFNKPNNAPLLINKKFKEDYELIRNSNLFDDQFYFEKYFDVKQNDIDPIYHYLTMGASECCNPCEDFNTKYYIKYSDVNKDNNPLVHYINNEMHDSHLKRYSAPVIDNMYNQLSNKVTIIIPIYNAYDDLKICIESVLKYSKRKFELLLINDCSPDKRINELLEKYQNHPNIRIIQNQTNKGFVGTVNVGLKNSEGDVILLNSDTIVTPKWLEKLTVAAYSKDNIGTVTPFSNNSGAFSVPEMNKENIIPQNLNINSMANIVEKASEFEYMSVPTGNGFCMYIKRSLIDCIGFFDEETFGRGYGEENDYCMRAINNGWINIIDDSTYIVHNKGSSFSNEREQLIRDHIKLINMKHPSYNHEIQRFLQSDTLKKIHDRINHSLNMHKLKKTNKKRILFVIHSENGGTFENTLDLMKCLENEYDCYLLFAHINKIKIYHYYKNNLTALIKFSLKTKWFAEIFYHDEFKHLYLQILAGFKIDLVHIMHFMHHTFDLVKIAKSLGIPVGFTFHDYYMACPSFILLDENYNYCEGKCNENLVNCQLPSKTITNHPIMKSFINEWRENVEEILSLCDYFVSMSDFVKNFFINMYSNSFKDNFYIIEHGRTYDVITEKLFDIPSVDEPIKILFMGHILRHKGSKLIKDIYDLDKTNQIEFHFLGTTDENLEGFGIHHGKYVREDMIKYIREIKPSFIGIFSICPETYCYTLTEAWSFKIPVLSTQIGVIEERMNKNNGGLFINKDDPLDAYNTILDIKKDSEKYIEIQNNIEKIKFKSEKEMSNEYLEIFKKFI